MSPEPISFATGREDEVPGLLRSFSIEAEDIAANRDGRLGPNQARNLARTRPILLAQILGTTLAIVAVVLVVTPKPVVLAVWVILAIAVVVGTLTFVCQIRFFGQALREGTVTVLVGPLATVQGYRSFLRLRVGDEMPVRLHRRFPFHGGRPYAVYQAPRVRRIVGVEPAVDPTSNL